MNERIQELAKQAYIADASRNPNWKFKPETELLLKQLSGFNEKFAELIVEECIGCCEQVISDPVPESVDTWLNGGEQCIQEIKQHFGLGMSVEDKKQIIKDLLGVNK